jgi:hypothetical protein
MHPDYEKRLTEAMESTATQIARIGDMLQEIKEELSEGGSELGKFFQELAGKFGL